MIDLGAGCAITDLATGAAWSSETLRFQISQRAAVLANQGIKPGDRVIVAHGGTCDFFADLFAIWHLGACAACANPDATGPELSALVDLITPSAMIVGTLAQSNFAPGKPKVLCLAEGGDASSIGPSTVEPDDPALILLTSGSTGVPKAVVHSFRSLSARIGLNRKHIGDATLARSLCLLPTHFGHGLIGNCLTPLAASGKLYLMTGNSVRAAAGLGAMIDREGISFMSSVPSFWRLVLKMSKPPTNGTLKQVNVGSAPLSAELWHAISEWAGCEDVVNMYGLTETANWVAGASARNHTPADGLVGVMWGGEAAVLGADDQISRAGEGRILLKAPSTMTEYLGQQALTESMMQDGWLITGDVGSIDADGAIRLTGRTRTEINRAGIKIHPEEVELMLERHPDIAEACAFAVPDPVAGQVVGVAVAAINGAEQERPSLVEWCASQIRREAIPSCWYFLTEIPKTNRGKIDRHAVRSICLEGGKEQ